MIFKKFATIFKLFNVLKALFLPRFLIKYKFFNNLTIYGRFNWKVIIYIVSSIRYITFDYFKIFSY